MTLSTIIVVLKDRKLTDELQRQWQGKCYKDVLLIGHLCESTLYVINKEVLQLWDLRIWNIYTEAMKQHKYQEKLIIKKQSSLENLLYTWSYWFVPRKVEIQLWKSQNMIASSITFAIVNWQ